MSQLIIIVAIGKNNGIGKEGKLLWHLPDDLKFFKQQTLGSPMIMGRKTYESIGRPLPGRRNLVLSRQKEFSAPGIEVFPDLDTAIKACPGAEKIFIAGGGEIYKQALPMVDTLMVTRVEHIAEADAFFPEINPEIFRLVSVTEHAADDKHPHAFAICFYERKKD
jgi:dihydrofolate reductase